MKLNRAIFTLTALALFSTAAQAQTVGLGSYDIDAVSASVSQAITVTVPKRFGLHLHLNTWNLDLADVDVNGVSATNEGINCVRAGDHSSGATGTGRDFLYFGAGATATSTKNDKILSLINAATFEGDQFQDVDNAYSYNGALTWADPANPGVGGTVIDAPIGGYPGFYVNDDVLVWKGPIMCSFQTIVQKFSNSSSGFNFTAQLSAGTASTFPLPLYVRDFIKGPAIAGVTTSSAVLTTAATAATTLATGTAGTTTGGWLDDHLLQVIVLDGTETNGTYVGNVTYTLADATPPAPTPNP
jgi:hypothetical protein